MPPPDIRFAGGTCLEDSDRRIRVLRLDPASIICLRDDIRAWLGVEFTPSVRCGSQVPACPLRMNVFAPASAGLWPLVVLAPGGPATVAGQNYLDAYAALLASHGLVVMASQWRQLDFDGSGYPTAFADIACAIGAARQMAGAYGADPDRVTLVGHSLGGWAASIVLLTPGGFTPDDGSCNPTAGSLRPDAVVLVAGAMNEPTTTVPDETDYVRSFLQLEPNAAPSAWATVDPFALAAARSGPEKIPTTVIAGDRDQFIPLEVARTFQNALVAGDHGSRLVEIPGADHLSIFTQDATLDAIVQAARAR